MKKIYIAITYLLLTCFGLQAEEQDNVVRLTLKDAITLAQHQSVDAAVALNELKTSYWEYRTHVADQLPEVNFKGTLPSYSKQYSRYQQSDGTYAFVQDNNLSMDGAISIDQNIALTGGKISLNSSLNFSRQLGHGAFNEYMSVPVGLTLTQPIFGVNDQKWNRRIEPVRYQEAKAAYIESVEGVTISTIAYFFNLLLAKENLATSVQNLDNANKLYDIAIAKRKIGHISESELMQLKLSALQAKGKRGRCDRTGHPRICPRHAAGLSGSIGESPGKQLVCQTHTTRTTRSRLCSSDGQRKTPRYQPVCFRGIYRERP